TFDDFKFFLNGNVLENSTDGGNVISLLKFETNKPNNESGSFAITAEPSENLPDGNYKIVAELLIDGKYDTGDFFIFNLGPVREDKLELVVNP
ncbi:MAG: hypothetical protein IKY14_04460, partial [Erysipelotrichaceae bacterium]|nr:hypothetical protein [Erysipelotrichaceae bacterium]